MFKKVIILCRSFVFNKPSNFLNLTFVMLFYYSSQNKLKKNNFLTEKKTLNTICSLHVRPIYFISFLIYIFVYSSLHLHLILSRVQLTLTRLQAVLPFIIFFLKLAARLYIFIHRLLNTITRTKFKTILYLYRRVFFCVCCCWLLFRPVIEK